ncbi:glycosyltransferase family 4 protein [Sporolactobacillus sp. CPB3-1]|uniref:Glycosyltransferase family 4 protein n=1 Tax=Sporolactobacillus mangiferae TaxID=2940498 RepID=A0ABT0M8H5_9BACL|nr:glycosyltransferase family 4 protein [Sporolactobacillus mangiferae]MCL1631169.1 glycosyltransferase family 4 protein [Sporolactobacillus mangiferae]
MTNAYPSKDHLYKNAFIHRRVLEYKRKGINVEVLIPSNKYSSYIFEGIKVVENNIHSLRKQLNNYKPHKIIIHFLMPPIMSIISQLEYEPNIFIWIHLFEATSWKRRVFNINYRFPGFVLRNIIQLSKLKKFVLENKSNKKIHYIFVSNWVKKTMEKDIGVKIENYSIIPNLIDGRLFNYKKKSTEDIKKILLIRPFNTKKYANDLAVKFILGISKKKYFNKISITIYGEGRYYKKLIKKIVHFPNVHCYNHFLSQKEIKNEHDKNGIFLCPTRQDSQGVSMCEAMSSGLVVLTSNNSAVPEFCTHDKSGMLSDNINEMINQYENLYNHPWKFLEISKTASEEIQKKCSFTETTDREILLLLTKQG